MKNIKFILHQMKPLKWWFALVLTMLIVQSAASIMTIGIQQRLIDSVFVQEQLEHLTLYLIIFVVSFTLQAGMITLVGYTFHSILFKIRYSLYDRVSRFILEIPVRSFQNERISKYVDVLNNYVFSAAIAVGFRLPQGLFEIFYSLVLMAIVGWYSPVILGSIVVFSSLYIYLGYHFGPKLKAAASSINEQRRELGVMLEEGISSTREVIAFHRQDYETSAYRRLFNKYFEKVIAEGKVLNNQTLASQPLKWGMNLFIIMYGCISLLQGNMTIGVFVVVYQFGRQLMNSYERVYSFFMAYSGYMVKIEGIKEFLESDKIKDGTLPLMEPVKELRLDQIVLSYDKDAGRVLDGISMDIPIGKKIALVGRSGSGKSTIAQVLTRFYDPDEGRVIVNGHTLSEYKRADWSNKLAVVQQNPYLFPDTIRNNLRFGHTELTNDQLEAACRITEIHDFIMTLSKGYDTEIGERGIMLSGGQRQRIALARAVIMNSALLILDEATSALDLETERRVQAQIDAVRAGKTTIVIAHRLSTIRNADMIYVISKGQIVEKGTHDELMTLCASYYKMLKEEPVKKQDKIG